MKLDLHRNPDARMLISFSPLLQRRPQTSYHGQRGSVASARTKSAQSRPETVTMPRTNVSVARFYDWSDDLGDCVSVSKLYRDVASIPRGYNDKMKGRGKAWCSDGIHINPGRMFVRDKASLTRGEKEIIQGIYRNRGDVPKEGQYTQYQSEWYNVRSHKDAWLIGKHFHKTISRSDLDDSLENLYNIDNNTNSPRIAIPHKHELDKNGRYTKPYEEGPIAPPSTPDSMNHKRLKIPPIHTRGSNMNDNEKQESDSRKGKMYVNIFLPRIPSELQEENTFVSLQERQQTSVDAVPSPREKRDGKKNKLMKERSSNSTVTTSNSNEYKQKDHTPKTNNSSRDS